MTGYCELCGKYCNCDTHHIFNGAYRKKSEKYGATAQVCRRCHEAIHSEAKLRRCLKLKYQIRIQTEYGLSDDEFIELFGKSYKLKRGEKL